MDNCFQSLAAQSPPGDTVAPASVRNATYFLGYGTLWIVGQDGILRAGCQPALGGLFVYKRSGRVTNPPQVANLPHGAGKAGSFRAAELGTALTAGTTSDWRLKAPETG